MKKSKFSKDDSDNDLEYLIKVNDMIEQIRKAEEDNIKNIKLKKEEQRQKLLKLLE